MKKTYAIIGVVLIVSNMVIAFANLKSPNTHLTACNEFLGALIMLCFAFYFWSSGWRIVGWVFLIASVILGGMTAHYIWRAFLA